MQKLADALAAAMDPVLLMGRIAEQVCLFTPRAHGAALSIATKDEALVVVSAHGAVSSQLGRVIPFSDAFQSRALRSLQPEVVDDVLTDARIPLSIRALCVSLDIRSFVVTPLTRDGAGIGTMLVTSAEPTAFRDVDITAVSSMTTFISALINSHSEMTRLLGDLSEQPGQRSHASSTTQFLAELLMPERAAHDRQVDALEQLFVPGAIESAFQPIIDLSTDAIVAVEALARFPAATQCDTGSWFARARSVGRGVELEMLALQTMFDAFIHLPPQMPVAVNLSPLAALDVDIQALLMTADRGLILEITEHEPFPGDLREALEPLRSHDVRLAVDDAGAGYANMTQILRLRPDIIKIDGELISGIDRDPARRALAFAVVRLAEELGAATVGEAIERSAELAVLRQIGVDYGQGYLLCRPTPPLELNFAAPVGSASGRGVS